MEDYKRAKLPDKYRLFQTGQSNQQEVQCSENQENYRTQYLLLSFAYF